MLVDDFFTLALVLDLGGFFKEPALVVGDLVVSDLHLVPGHVEPLDLGQRS